MSVNSELLKISREAMKTHARTFDRASLFFSPSTREDARLLYLWCRFCDDFIDHSESREQAAARVEILLKYVDQDDAFQSPELIENHSQDLQWAFDALFYLQKKYSIPLHYPRELIKGMQFDAHYRYFDTEEELYLYCYRVASVVGLMMCHIMGVSRENALKEASDLGTAMQLSNMARDIHEDYRMGRIYAPKSWWMTPSLAQNELDFKSQHSLICREFVNRSRQFYDSARLGLSALPLRCAIAVSCAIELYSEIGERALHSTDWTIRTIVPRGRKFFLMLKGIFRALQSRSLYPSQGFKRTPIQHVRTFNEDIQLS